MVGGPHTDTVELLSDSDNDNEDTSSYAGAGPVPNSPSTGTEPRAILCMIAVGVVAIVVASAGGFAAGTTYAQHHTGVTEAVAHITLSANTSADPCTDMWNFACGGYEAMHLEYNTMYDYQRYLNRQIEKRLAAMAEAPNPPDYARMHASCLATEQTLMPGKNVSAIWLLNRGLPFNDLEIGWDINPMDNRQTVAYVYNTSFASEITPTLVRHNDTSTCGKAIIALVRTVVHNAYVVSALVYGETERVCDMLDRVDVHNKTTQPPVVLQSAGACLSHVVGLWPNVIAAEMLALAGNAAMPTTIVTLCEEVRAHFAAMLRMRRHNTAAAKIQSVACRANYNGPVEVYQMEWDADYTTSYLNLRHQQFMRDVAQTSVDSVWDMPALSVNAAYSSVFNELYITPAMAMFAFESNTRRSFTLARLGFILAHELAHALDPTGIYFDATGMYTLETVLTGDEQRAYTNDIACIASEFDNNRLTLQEDVADHLAMAVVVDMVRLSQAELPVTVCSPNCTILTTQPQFYVYFAQTWCSSESSQQYANRNRDVHSPNRARVEHALVNAGAASAFQCAGAKTKPCRVFGM